MVESDRTRYQGDTPICRLCQGGTTIKHRDLSSNLVGTYNASGPRLYHYMYLNSFSRREHLIQQRRIWTIRKDPHISKEASKDRYLTMFRLTPEIHMEPIIGIWIYQSKMDHTGPWSKLLYVTCDWQWIIQYMIHLKTKNQGIWEKWYFSVECQEIDSKQYFIKWYSYMRSAYEVKDILMKLV